MFVLCSSGMSERVDENNRIDEARSIRGLDQRHRALGPVSLCPRTSKEGQQWSDFGGGRDPRRDDHHELLVPHSGEIDDDRCLHSRHERDKDRTCAGEGGM